MTFEWSDERIGFTKQYVDKIKNPILKTLFEELILALPNYWWTKPSSSTGKYHSKQQIGNQGLLKHSLIVFKIMEYLTSLECTKQLLMKDLDEYGLYLDDYIDLLLISAFIHDAAKYGLESEEGYEYTTPTHPDLIYNFIYTECGVAYKRYEAELECICKLVASHHGQWNKDKRMEFQLPYPKTYGEMLVHQCDYLGSRKDIFMDLPELELDKGYME